MAGARGPGSAAVRTPAAAAVRPRSIGGAAFNVAVRIENFEDFGTTTNGRVSARAGFVRASVSTGFRAPTPGQQNGFNSSTIFDPALGDLVNNGTIPHSMVVQAAVAGLGIAVGRSMLIGQEMEHGTLVPVFDRQAEARGCRPQWPGSESPSDARC